MEEKEKKEEVKEEEVKKEGKQEESKGDKEESKKENNKEEKKEEKKEEEVEEIEVPDKFKPIVESIEKLTVLELSELVKVLEKKFGVSAQMMAAPMPAAGSGALGGAEGGGEEKSEFNVVLSQVGDKKIEVIKAVRDITQKGLKEAKDLVDAAMSSPQVIKESVKKDEAEEIKKKLESAGAKVELK